MTTLKQCMNKRPCNWLDKTENYCLFQEYCGYQILKNDEFHEFIRMKISTFKNELRYWHILHNIPITDIIMEVKYDDRR